MKNIVRIFEDMFEGIEEIEDSTAVNEYLKRTNNYFIFAVLQFDDSYKDLEDLSAIQNFKVSIR